MKPPSDEKLKFFMYARKSSESEDRQVQSIEDQTNRLTDLSKAASLDVAEILTEAKSAKKPYNRPVFDDMLKRIEKGDANAILCWQINRLSRNPIDSGKVSWMLQQGILKCIQTIDRKYLPDDNVLLFNVESGMANQYIIDLRKNCRRGMEGKAERGWQPSFAAVGYLNDKLERTIIPDKDRYHLVRKMWDMLLSGTHNPEQIREIVNNEWGFRTPKRKKWGGKELSTAGIYKLFGNIFYTGMFKWAGRLYPGNHKAMITLEEYDRAQVILGRNGSPRPKTHEFAFTGLIRCAECGSMVTATEKVKMVKTNKAFKTYVYYHCTRKNRKTKCRNKPIPATELEEQIELWLESFTIAPEFLHWALDVLTKNKANAVENTTHIKAAQVQVLSETQKELDTLTRMRVRELIDDEAFIKERDVLRDSITKLKEQLKGTQDNSGKWIELTERAFHFTTYARQKFVTGTLEAQKDIFIRLGSNFQLKDSKLIFEASEWLLQIVKEYPALYAEYKRLELEKNLNIEMQKLALHSIILRWCTIVEDVRTAIERNNLTEQDIPHLEQINTDNGP